MGGGAGMAPMLLGGTDNDLEMAEGEAFNGLSANNSGTEFPDSLRPAAPATHSG